MSGTTTNKQIISDFFNVSFYRYGYQVVIFGSSVISSKLLSPSDYGLVALITVFTGFIANFTDSGISSYIIRSDYGTRFLRAMYSLSVYWGLALSGLVFLLAYPIALFRNDMNLFLPAILTGVIIFFQSLAVVPTASMRKRGLFKQQAQIEFVAHSSSTIVTIVTAYFGAGFWSILLAQLYAAVVLFFGMTFRSKFEISQFSFKEMRLGLRKSQKTLTMIGGNSALAYWTANFGNLITGNVYGKEKLGIYNRSMSLSSLYVNLLGGVLNSIMLPTIKKLQSNSEVFLQRLSELVKLILFVCAIPCTLAVFFGERAILLIWGITWVEVADFLPLLMFISYCIIVRVIYFNIFILNNREKRYVSISLVNSIAQIAVFGLAFFFELKFVIMVLAIVSLCVLIPGQWFIIHKMKLYGKGWQEIIMMIVKSYAAGACCFFYYYNNTWLTGFFAIAFVVFHLDFLNKAVIEKVLVKLKLKGA